MKPTVQWLFSIACGLAGVARLVSGCGQREPAGSASEPAATGGVAAANYPLAFFAETLLAGAEPVVFDAPEDEDPAFWQPDDTALTRFQAAKVILMNGAGYSKWAEQASLPQSRVVDTSAAFAPAFIETKDTVTHSHGPEGEHSHAGIAFTTWIDFDQAARQLAAVKTALLPLVDETGKQALEERAAALAEKLAGFDLRLLSAGEKLAQRPLLGSHPVYQYLARRYRLNLREVHWEPDTKPDADAVEELKEILREHPATVMLWEGNPLEESVALLKEMGIESLVFAPCGNRPEEGDFLSVMESNVTALEDLVK